MAQDIALLCILYKPGLATAGTNRLHLGACTPIFGVKPLRRDLPCKLRIVYDVAVFELFADGSDP